MFLHEWPWLNSSGSQRACTTDGVPRSCRLQAGTALTAWTPADGIFFEHSHVLSCEPSLPKREPASAGLGRFVEAPWSSAEL
eukprot:9132865-Alexandrium_andersonii.AAC.1